MESNERLNFWCEIGLDWIELNWVVVDVQISTGKNDKGLKLYDPGYLNTAPVRSSICYIDGDEGILRYRPTGGTQLRNWLRVVPIWKLLISSVSSTSLAVYSNLVTLSVFA